MYKDSNYFLLPMKIYSLKQNTSQFRFLYLGLPWTQKFTLIPMSAFQVILKTSHPSECNTPFLLLNETPAATQFCIFGFMVLWALHSQPGPALCD